MEPLASSGTTNIDVVLVQYFVARVVAVGASRCGRYGTVGTLQCTTPYYYLPHCTSPASFSLPAGRQLQGRGIPMIFGAYLMMLVQCQKTCGFPCPLFVRLRNAFYPRLVVYCLL